MLTRLTFSNFYSIGVGVRVREAIEHTNCLYHKKMLGIQQDSL